MNFSHCGELHRKLVSKLEIKWVLKVEELQLKKKGLSIHSPIFFVQGTNQKLHLRLYSMGCISSNDGYMGLFLENDSDFGLHGDFHFSILTNSNVKTNTEEWINCSILSKELVGQVNFVSRSTLFDPSSELVNDHKITIVCSITEAKAMFVNNEKNDVCKIYEKFFTHKKHSDITIKCKDMELNLHKCILATRSIVFEAMLDSDMQEKKEDIIEINGTDPDVMYQFFKYLYTNTVDDFRKIAKDLLIVADKYLVFDLKHECERVLCDGINFENAMEYIKIAEDYDIKELRRRAIKFIGLHITRFSDKPEFKSLAQEKLLEIINEHVCFLKKK